MKQRISQLPLLTRMAFWWLVAVGVAGPIATVISFIVLWWDEGGNDGGGLLTLWLIIIAASIGAGLIYLLPAFLLLTKKRKAWIAAVAILFVLTLVLEVIILVYARRPSLTPPEDYLWYYVPGIVVCFIPFILIILDTSQYWQMTRKVDMSSDASLTEPADEP